MAEEKDESKTTVEDKDKKDEKETEDEFSDLFDEEETEEQEDLEEEPKEDKPAKEKKVKKQSPNVDEIVNERVATAEKRLERRADVTDFFATDRGKMFGKYREQIAKAAIDPRFVNIPVSKLPQLILKDTVYEKILNDARSEADKEAADSVTGGSSQKSMTPEELTKIDPTTMSKDEFAALKSRALRGEFTIKQK